MQTAKPVRHQLHMHHQPRAHQLFRCSGLILCTTLLLIFLLSGSVWAHNLWLNATDFSPVLSGRTGAHTKIYFGFGHRFPVDDFLAAEKLTEFNLILPDQSVQRLDAGNGGFLSTPIVLKTPGGHTVAAATKPGFYTMFSQDGRILHRMGSMEGLEDIVLSIYFENYTKALIDVAPSAPDTFTRPIGQNMEIVPLENPYLKRAGDKLQVQVLYQGEPVPYCQVSATFVGFSSRDAFAYSCKTDSKGVASIRLLNQGHWMVLAVMRKPAPEELGKQCRELKNSASLSFGVQ